MAKNGENEQPPRPPESEGEEGLDEERPGPTETELENHIQELSREDLEYRKQRLQDMWSEGTPHIKKEINRIDAELRRRDKITAVAAETEPTVTETPAEPAPPEPAATPKAPLPNPPARRFIPRQSALRLKEPRPTEAEEPTPPSEAVTPTAAEEPSEPREDLPSSTVRETPPAEPPRRRGRERGPEGPEDEPFERVLVDAVRREAHESLAEMERLGRLTPADVEIRRARVEQATEVRVNAVFKPEDGSFVDLVYDLEATTPEGDRKVVPGRMFRHDFFGPLADLAQTHPSEVRARLIDAFERERDFRSNHVRIYEKQLATAQKELAAATEAKERPTKQADVDRFQNDLDRNRRILEKLPDMIRRVKRRENVFGERPAAPPAARETSEPAFTAGRPAEPALEATIPPAEAAKEDAERAERFKREFFEAVRQRAYADLSARGSMTPEAVAARRHEIDRATSVIIKPEFRGDGRLNKIIHYLVSTDSAGRETWAPDRHPDGEFGPIAAIIEQYPDEGRQLLADAITKEKRHAEEFCTFLEGDLEKKQQELAGSSNEEERASIRRLMHERQGVLERTRAALANMPGLLDRLARGENIFQQPTSEAVALPADRPAAVERSAPAEHPVPPVFEMPPSPEEVGGLAPEAQPAVDRLAAAIRRHYRRLYGLPATATDEELNERVRQGQVSRLGLPPDADAAAIARAEHEWARRRDDLPPFTDEAEQDEPSESELAPYYAFYGVPPGSGYAAIQRKEEEIRIQREGVPPQSVGAPRAAAERPEPAAVPGEPAAAATPTPEPATAKTEAAEQEAAAKAAERERLAAEMREKSDEDLARETSDRARAVVALEMELARIEDPIRKLEIRRQLQEHRMRLEAIRDALAGRRAERARQAAESATSELSPERMNELVTGALEGPTFPGRSLHRADLGVLRDWQKLPESSRTPEAEQRVWRSLLNIYEARQDQTASQEDAVALRDSYRGLLRRGGFSQNVRPNVRVLDTISRTLSFDEGLAAYRELAERMGDLRRFDTTETNRVPPLVADEIGEEWLLTLRYRVREAQRRPDRVRLEDPELFGRLVSIIEGPGLPETIVDRLRAADCAAGILRGERSPHEAETLLARHGRDSLTATRTEYARALMGRGSIFHRTSEQKLTELRSGYTAALTARMNDRVREITARLDRVTGGEKRLTEVDPEAQAAFVEAVLQYRGEEESALRDAMRDRSESSAAKRLKELWRRHPHIRMAVGLGLSGGIMASVATGNVAAAGVFQAMKSVFSGVGAGMTTEAIIEKSREAYGDTKKIKKAEDVHRLTDDELKRKIAAHTVRSVEYAPGIYTQAMGRGQTVYLLTGEFSRRETEQLKKKIEEMGKLDLSPDEIVEAVTSHSLSEEHSLLGTYETRRDRDRSFAIKKWLSAAGAGSIVGLLTQGIGMRRFAEQATERATKKAGEMGGRHLAESAAGAHEPAGAPVGTLEHHPAASIHDTLTHHPAAPDATADTLHSVPAGPEAPDTTGAVPQHDIPAPRDSTVSDLGSSRELYEGQLKDAVVRKSEGIEHALRRQLEAAPEKFGFHGDGSNTGAIHDWSGGEAHRIALREGLVNTNGEELRVAFDADHPAQFILGHDGSVHSVGAETYAFHPEPAGAAVAAHAPEVGAPAPETPSDLPTVSDVPSSETGVTGADVPHTTVTEGVTSSEVAAEPPIELSSKAETAYAELKKTFTAFGDTIDKKTLAELQRDVEQQPARHALKRSLIEKFVDRQEGADHDLAKKYAKALENLFKRLPKGSIGERDTIGHILRRVAGQIEPPRVVAM